MDEERMKLLEDQVTALEQLVVVLQGQIPKPEPERIRDTYVVTSGKMPKFSSQNQQECEDFAENLGKELTLGGTDINNSEFVIEIQLQ